MKNTLAENMLRFGVKNLKAEDVKKIEESVLTEDGRVGDVDLKSNPKWNALLRATFDKQPADSMEPFTVGPYIFKPEEVKASYSKGIITTFTTGYYGLPALTPLTDANGIFVDNGVNFDRATINTLAYNERNVKAPEIQNYAKYLNESFSQFKLPVLQAAYNANPNKANWDKMIITFKQKLMAAAPNQPSTEKTLNGLLTGNVKALLTLA